MFNRSFAKSFQFTCVNNWQIHGLHTASYPIALCLLRFTQHCNYCILLIIVTKSLLYYYIIIYPFECETYTNTCLQWIVLQYVKFNLNSVKYYSFSNIDCGTVGKTVFTVVQSAKQSSSDLLPIQRVRSPITDSDWKFWPTSLYVYSQLQSIYLYVW